MGIYSETTSNTPVDPTLEFYPTSCYNCNNDCPGILLEVFRQEPDWDNLSFDELSEYNYKLFSVFIRKGYHSVNYSTGNYFCPVHHLEMYKGEARKLAVELEDLGYVTRIVSCPTNTFKCNFVIIKAGNVLNPCSMLPVFETLRIIGGK